MKNVLEYINEATSNQKWVAIEVTSVNQALSGSKQTTSQRVVSWDTYQEIKASGSTKGGYMKVLSVDTLGPATRNKEEAMSYLDKSQKTARKTKINKGECKYIAYLISCGKMSASGKTSWDWNLWDTFKGEETEIYMMSFHDLASVEKYGSGVRSFLVGAKGSLKIGDSVFGVDNDSQKKLSGVDANVVGICKCTYDDFVAKYRELCPKLCKKPSRQFGKTSDGLPWARMGQLYSIKGITE